MSSIKTILVTGSSGQLGRSLKLLSEQCSQFQYTFINREQMDLSNSESIVNFFKRNKFDLIINCAAYTAVDKAEEQQELAYKINHLAVKQMAEIAGQNDSILIHISTDYVFDGTHYKPYTEDHATHPQAVYGDSKLKGELAIQELASKAIIIRTSWVYSEYGKNFLKTMLKIGEQRDELNVIFDQIGSPTYAKDLAEALLKIIVSIDNNNEFFLENAPVSLYHFSNEGVCSWYDFAQEIFNTSKISCKINPIETRNYHTPAKRPHYSVFNKAKIKHCFDLEIPYWKDSLQSCIATLQESKAI